MDSERESAIVVRLQREIDDARERLAEAHLAFRAAVGELPEDVPSPEDIPGIEEIAFEQRAALQNLKRAMQQHSDYVLRGVIPIEFGR